MVFITIHLNNYAQFSPFNRDYDIVFIAAEINLLRKATMRDVID